MYYFLLNFVSPLLLFEYHFQYSNALDVVLVLLLFAFGLILFYLFRFIRRRIDADNQEKIAQYKIYGFFTKLLFEEDLDERSFNEKVNKIKKKVPFDKPWCKELLIENIIDLDKNLKGNYSQLLIKIYLQLGLFNYMKSLLETGKSYYISKVIYYWRELGYAPSSKIIYPYVRHENEQVRTAAVLAYISLSDKDPLSILDEYVDRISPIDEIKLLDIIQRKKIKKPTFIGDWLAHERPSHVVFALKLIAYYNALEFKSAVIELIKSADLRIRESAIEVVRRLLIEDAEGALIDIYDEGNDKLKIKIVESLAAMGSRSGEAFLFQVVNSPNRSELLLAAMRGLKELDSELFVQNYPEGSTLCAVKKHVLDPYI
ncbi:HEAT repeat domain-containing protein [Belliella kenyensis]|uniref:HEAT repeat domain-containing protein n=1 Tax=Belliella kenyensis TaxID=1472724 RepID=A0ABV8EHF5_9BACT|nr:hypothetical protein [Belliella kenyensis]MCH7401195.1 hypothetical protein [Belliella kenyensis]MDN3604192.1 hypothetical protein [Belliella kenyensis]